MDTGFNYYFGADPSEYDLVVSNSEGGLERLRELGARRAEAVFWGADPELFRPLPVEKQTDVFFYGYGDKFRQEWMEAMVGEPSRRLPHVDFSLGGEDFRGDIGARAAARRRAVQRLRAGDLARRGSTSTSRGARMRPSTRRPRRARSSSRCPVRRSSPTRTRGSSAGSSRAASCSSSRTRTRRPPPTGSCSTIPAAGRGDGPRRPRARARRAHLPPPRAAGCSSCSGCGVPEPVRG